MDLTDTKNRLQEASKLLVEKTTSAEKLKSLSVVLKGLTPKLDIALQVCEENFSKIEKLQSGDVISLTAESLPAETEEEKKRKKAILAFIKTWEDLKSEVERVQKELNSAKDPKQQIQSAGKIAGLAKGPFGLITFAAVLIVGFFAFTNMNKNSQAPETLNKTPAQSSASPAVSSIKGIIFDGKKIPLSELVEGKGPECDQASHYHAKDHTSAKALDGSIVSDPGGCGFGKVSQVEVVDFH